MSKSKCFFGKGYGRLAVFFLIIAAVIVLIGLIFFLFHNIFSFSQPSWRAVFLTNGQTYFGKIVKKNASSLVLKDVYYLRIDQIAPETEGGQVQPQFNLFRLGDTEIHNPQNWIEINWTHVLFIEKLRTDSQVISTINQMK